MISVAFFFDTIRGRTEPPILAVDRAKLPVFKRYGVVVMIPFALFARLAGKPHTVQRVVYCCRGARRESGYIGHEQECNNGD